MKTFIVLGMHRSATSLVAKALSHEMHVGDVLEPANASQPHGHWENVEFLRLNNAILQAAGGSWDRPPPEEAILAQRERFSDHIRWLVESEGQGRELWGWKEPRTTLTIKLYLPYLVNPHFIACFREPLVVALSLQRRDKFPLERGLKLAEEYNRRLLKFLSEWTLGKMA